jgi:hypothetical protein
MRAMAFLFLALGFPVVVALPSRAGDPKAPEFPSPGTTLPRSFCPLVINGNWKDRNGEAVDRYHSVVCHFGLKPVALVFVRDPKDEAVFDFLKQLEAKVTANKAAFLGGCAVFLAHDDKRDRPDLSAKDLVEAANNKEKLVKLVKEKAATAGLKQVLIGITNKVGPKDFHIQARADVTVILYEKCRVISSKEYKRGEFDEKAAAVVLKKIDTWMAGMKERRARAKKETAAVADE